jgi:hypothetical protein
MLVLHISAHWALSSAGCLHVQVLSLPAADRQPGAQRQAGTVRVADLQPKIKPVDADALWLCYGGGRSLPSGAA